MKKSAIVVGAGIVGLATARALTNNGFNVTVLDKTQRAVGASIRNFGMVWPIGQPDGELYQLAKKSSQIWRDISNSVGMWYNQSGSLHVAYSSEEWIILNELFAQFEKEGRPITLLTPSQISIKYPLVKQNNLYGGLFSADEMIVDPRIAVANVSDFLESFSGVQFLWNHTVQEVGTGFVKSGNKLLKADKIVICSGQDIETLFPETFISLPIVKCKLQMIRMSAPNNKLIGTSVCGGLSLLHYTSFKSAPSLDLLRNKLICEIPDYIKYGIHVMVSQHEFGDLTVGDSHEYGYTFDPFDHHNVNELILNYLNSFMNASNWEISSTWNGVYPKMTDGSSWYFNEPIDDVYLLNGLGGAGMTLSFGVAEKLIDKII
ncbi:TIGR03364 family FAD-dependent oxidoreductase [Sediminibacterium sp.]|uniref:TIGR03364 family FAD-dependent oxidoreductase n=1 Tax=Sediminibacterium sp. TaxID=1917865 RepID=UPI002734F766|nr:TIGR03364 family FAD-dependent oxidoreductase [Sediminibacterium sp.]MDP3392757.1 TIGR03364 family FAD-dependent oxidoreductase [Sediminibacterium sp.]MDP3565879.1 TIGR03364 family FAD-dependent oxidoreductase [Sediminibacterium sp.]